MPAKAQQRHCQNYQSSMNPEAFSDPTPAYKWSRPCKFYGPSAGLKQFMFSELHRSLNSIFKKKLQMHKVYAQQNFLYPIISAKSGHNKNRCAFTFPNMRCPFIILQCIQAFLMFSLLSLSILLPPCVSCTLN